MVFGYICLDNRWLFIGRKKVIEYNLIVFIDESFCCIRVVVVIV